MCGCIVCMGVREGKWERDSKVWDLWGHGREISNESPLQALVVQNPILHPSRNPERGDKVGCASGELRMASHRTLGLDKVNAGLILILFGAG
jgi:hypothetical protein